VNEISDEPSSVSFNLNVSEDSNRAGIDDDGLTLGLSALPLGCPRLSWATPSCLSGEPGLRMYEVECFFVTMHQHVSTSGSRHLRGMNSIPVDNAADSSACWSVGKGKGDGKRVGMYCSLWLLMKKRRPNVNSPLRSLRRRRPCAVPYATISKPQERLR
jgi:hypothetical protein